MSASDKLGTCFFAFWLLLFTLPAYLIAVVNNLTEYCLAPSSFGLRRRTLVFVLQAGWRVALLLCSCWIEIHSFGFEEVMAHVEANAGRPTVVVMNHVSFLDTILATTSVPYSKIHLVKMLTSSHLLKLPVIGTLIKACKHLTVPFKHNTISGGLEVDKELMAERQKEMEDHVRSGGWGAWFPEGVMNRGDWRKLGMFRAGGFDLPASQDVDMIGLTFVGNNVCWPVEAPIGGRPAKIGVNYNLLTGSSFELLREIAPGPDGPSEEHRERAVALANKAQDVIQAAIDELVSRGFSGNSGRADRSEQEALIVEQGL